MKPSHFVTPRSLSECFFDPSADPIERLVEPWRGRTIAAAILAVIVIAAIVAAARLG